MNNKSINEYIEKLIEKEKNIMKHSYLGCVISTYLHKREIINAEEYYNKYYNLLKDEDEIYLFKMYLKDNKEDIIHYLNDSVVKFLNSFYNDFYNSIIRGLLKDKTDNFNSLNKIDNDILK